MSDRNQAILWRLDAAAKKVQQGLAMRHGGSAAEDEYGAAYQAAVAAGLKPQIRAKYRPRRG
jgi:hypothetical protein